MANTMTIDLESIQDLYRIISRNDTQQQTYEGNRSPE